jgi:dolichol-phosphate mannosyltransferase
VNSAIGEVRLAVITPIGRESETLLDFVATVSQELVGGDRHFLVTDVFTDARTKSLISKISPQFSKKLTNIHLEESKGIASVYLEGYRKALSEGFTHFLEIDAGFSHDPKQIGAFRELANQYNVVLGNRFAKNARYHTTIFRRLLSQGGSALARILLRVKIRDMTSGFQLFDRDAISTLLDIGISSKGPFFQTEMKFYISKSKLSLIEVPISYSNPSRKIGFADIYESLTSLVKLAVQR